MHVYGKYMYSMCVYARRTGLIDVSIGLEIHQWNSSKSKAKIKRTTCDLELVWMCGICKGKDHMERVGCISSKSN